MHTAHGQETFVDAQWESYPTFTRDENMRSAIAKLPAVTTAMLSSVAPAATTYPSLSTRVVLRFYLDSKICRLVWENAQHLARRKRIRSAVHVPECVCCGSVDASALPGVAFRGVEHPIYLHVVALTHLERGSTVTQVLSDAELCESVIHRQASLSLPDDMLSWSFDPKGCYVESQHMADLLGTTRELPDANMTFGDLTAATAFEETPERYRPSHYMWCAVLHDLCELLPDKQVFKFAERVTGIHPAAIRAQYTPHDMPPGYSLLSADKIMTAINRITKVTKVDTGVPPSIAVVSDNWEMDGIAPLAAAPDATAGQVEESHRAAALVMLLRAIHRFIAACEADGAWLFPLGLYKQCPFQALNLFEVLF